MAGHSKWSNIRHRKAAQDAKRVKTFLKIIRELVVAAKEGGASVEGNPRLRTAVDKALGSNMRRDTIDKAIQRGAGGGEGESFEELVYEGYGPGGVAVLIEAMTDNRNRTAADVRLAFSKAGGNLGTDGSVAYLFEKKGRVFISADDEDLVMELALDAGAEDLVVQDDGSIEVLTAPSDYLSVKDHLVSHDTNVIQSELDMIPATTVVLDEEGTEKMMRLIDALEDLDDVQSVYTNADFPAEVMDKLG